MQAYADAVTAAVVEWPAQWFWWHDIHGTLPKHRKEAPAGRSSTDGKQGTSCKHVPAPERVEATSALGEPWDRMAGAGCGFSSACAHLLASVSATRWPLALLGVAIGAAAACGAWGRGTTRLYAPGLARLAARRGA